MLLNYFSSLTPLTEKETALIDSLFVERTFRKRETLWQEGDPCKYFYFVEEGCLKLYKVDDKGENISSNSPPKIIGLPI